MHIHHWTLSPLLFASISVAAAETPHTVPLDIREFMKSQRCDEVADFYSDQHVTGQPYVYGIRSLLDGKAQGGDWSVIAWCTTKDHGYALVADLAGKEWPGGCRFPIRDVDFAGGLTVRNEDARWVIRSERDGLELIVSCESGQWTRRVID